MPQHAMVCGLHVLAPIQELLMKPHCCTPLWDLLELIVCILSPILHPHYQWSLASTNPNTAYGHTHHLNNPTLVAAATMGLLLIALVSLLTCIFVALHGHDSGAASPAPHSSPPGAFCHMPLLFFSCQPDTKTYLHIHVVYGLPPFHHLIFFDVPTSTGCL